MSCGVERCPGAASVAHAAPQSPLGRAGKTEGTLGMCAVRKVRVAALLRVASSPRPWGPPMRRSGTARSGAEAGTATGGSPENESCNAAIRACSWCLPESLPVRFSSCKRGCVDLSQRLNQVRRMRLVAPFPATSRGDRSERAVSPPRCRCERPPRRTVRARSLAASPSEGCRPGRSLTSCSS